VGILVKDQAREPHCAFVFRLSSFVFRLWSFPSLAPFPLSDSATMHGTFTQKLIMTVITGFAAACLLYLFRHVVQQAFWESNEGWKKSLYQRATPPPVIR
jgi:hypothetical protein